MRLKRWERDYYTIETVSDRVSFACSDQMAAASGRPAALFRPDTGMNVTKPLLRSVQEKKQTQVATKTIEAQISINSLLFPNTNLIYQIPDCLFKKFPLKK